MILPRPLPYKDNLTIDNINEIVKLINASFIEAEEFELCNKPNHFFHFDQVVRKSNGLHGPGQSKNNWYMIHGVIKGNRNRKIEKFGVLNFYCHVTKDIGLIWGMEDLHPLSWLTSGIDGVTNNDRLCKAWAMNGELIPRKGTKEGQLLTEILKESNIAIDNDWFNNQSYDYSSDKTDSFKGGESGLIETLEMIDFNLTKFGTYLDELARKSNVQLKQLI